MIKPQYNGRTLGSVVMHQYTKDDVHEYDDTYSSKITLLDENGNKLEKFQVSLQNLMRGAMYKEYASRKIKLWNETKFTSRKFGFSNHMVSMIQKTTNTYQIVVTLGD